MDPEYSKVFGFPDNSGTIDPDRSIISSTNELFKRSPVPEHLEGRIKSNLAVDKYQSLLAMGTSDGQIKLISLKGYEQEIDQAHIYPIIWIQFVPNQGKLISIDVQNFIKMWDLQTLALIYEGSIPIPEESSVTLLYTPPELTSQPLNHRHSFVGTKHGEVLIFDHELMQFSPLRVDGRQIFKDSRRNHTVTDIKCHPDKMHRLLITFDLSGVCVYSLNKRKAVYTFALIQEKHFNLGKALAAEWFGSEGDILVGFARGSV